MAPAQSADFEKAVEDSRKLKQKPSDNQLLELYGLYKAGTGADFASADKPGAFDFKGKAKYNAWKKVVDEGVTPEEAQKRYVELVEELKNALGYDA